jgi:rhodanese-related sulfurtransferase
MTATLPRTDNVSVQQVRELMAEDPLLRIIDVRTGGEFETMHIPGSFNIPLDTLDEHAGDLADLEHPIVLVCQSGARASKAHGALSDHGKDRLHLLEGGIAAWEAAGVDVVRGSTEKWAMDRQVRLAAGSMALAGVLASVFVPKAKWMAAGVAGGLVYSAVSNTCAMASVLGKLPYNQSNSCDIVTVLDEIRQDQQAA